MDWMNLSYRTEVSSRSDKLIFFLEKGELVHDKTYDDNSRLLDTSLRYSLQVVEPSCMGHLSDLF